MDKIRLIKPHITFEDVRDGFEDIFKTGMHTKGKNVDAFAKELSDYTGAKHTVFTTSATTALWLSLKLLGVGEGDEVPVSDFSYPASANVIEDLGATPVFVDVSLETYNMLPDDLERKITKKTKAVMPVDALGNPTGMHKIKQICQAHNIPMLEDAACGIGSSENNIRVGNIADISCFSFHPRKLMCTGEGGAITTNNDEWARWLDVKLNHGISGSNGIALDFTDFGYNFRMSELQAVMGRKQLSVLDTHIQERIAIRNAYKDALEPLGFIGQKSSENVVHNMQSIAFMVPDNINRDALILHLREKNIETTIGTYALSATTYYAQKYKNIQPNAKKLFDQVITLPCYSNIDITRVIDAIALFVNSSTSP